MHDVILVTIDSLRADHVGCVLGKEAGVNLTPGLDGWSRDAFVFGSAVSQSSHTSPSFLATLSGCYPCRYGDWFSKISEDRTMLQEILKANGYTTCAVNSNPYISTSFGFDKGFDFFEDNVKRVRAKGLWRKIDLQMLRLMSIVKPPYEPAEKITRQALSLLREAPSPRFLWIHYMDVHGPYIPSHGWGVKNRVVAGALWHKALNHPGKLSQKERDLLRSTYRERVRFMDRQLETLFREIDDENAIVVVLADHGDLLGEHGLFGHPLVLYDEVLRVPLIMKLPSTLMPGNGRVTQTVRTMDIAPTVLEMLGIEWNGTLDGKSFFPLMTDGSNSYIEETVISEVSRSHLCARKWPWKMIVNRSRDVRALYDLSCETGEERDLGEEHRSIAEEMEECISSHVDRFRDSGERGEGRDELEEEIKAQLKGLGYLE